MLGREIPSRKLFSATPSSGYRGQQSRPSVPKTLLEIALPVHCPGYDKAKQMDSFISFALGFPNELRLGIMLLAYLIVASTLFIGLLNHATEPVEEPRVASRSPYCPEEIQSEERDLGPLGETLDSDPLLVHRNSDQNNISWVVPVITDQPGQNRNSGTPQYNAAYKIEVEGAPLSSVRVFRTSQVSAYDPLTRPQWEWVKTYQSNGLDRLNDVLSEVEVIEQSRLRHRCRGAISRLEFNHPLEGGPRGYILASWQLWDDVYANGEIFDCYKIVVVSIRDEYLGIRDEIQVLHRMKSIGSKDRWVHFASFPSSSLASLWSAVKFVATHNQQAIMQSKHRIVRRAP